MDNFDDVGYWSSAKQCEAMGEIEYLRQQLAAALAACEAKDAIDIIRELKERK